MSNPNDPVLVSPDVHREKRLPPGQSLTRKWPILHYGSIPTFNRATWTFHIFGLLEQAWECSYDEFLALPHIKVMADMHCVTRWSKLDNLWEGVSTREILSKVKVLPQANYVLVHSDHGFTTNLRLDDFLGEDCLFAFKHNGQDLEPAHGYPLRLVIPRLYAWKSAKWVRAIELIEQDRAGFWERWEHGGYHMRGDPWAEQRFREDSPLAR
jgi:DMSO/TMAO reductase YedYZ molybdopterin-dependent catalytic subunit